MPWSRILALALLHRRVLKDASIPTYYGTKRVTEAILHLLKKDGARIVNTGSGAGPLYVAKQTEGRQKVLCFKCCKDITWEQIEEIAEGGQELCPLLDHGFLVFQGSPQHFLVHLKIQIGNAKELQCDGC
jgi:hypothetical protein